MTMDTYEGNYQDPQSLHKYLYCRADPVNGTDPTGQDDIVSAIELVGNIASLAQNLQSVEQWLKLAGQKVTVQFITDIRPPDAQVGVKTRQIVEVNGIGMILKTFTYTGTTDLIIAAPTGGSTFRQRVVGGVGHFTLTSST
jgi:hypothetical protein